MKHLEKANPQGQKVEVRLPGAWGGGTGELLLYGYRFCLEWWKDSGKMDPGNNFTLCMYLMPASHILKKVKRAYLMLYIFYLIKKNYFPTLLSRMEKNTSSGVQEMAQGQSPYSRAVGEWTGRGWWGPQQGCSSPTMTGLGCQPGRTKMLLYKCSCKVSLEMYFSPE